MTRIRAALPAVVVLLLSAVASWRALEAALRSTRLPFWDMAVHGYDGVILSDAVRRLDLVDFLVRVHGMSLWPPVLPLLETPFLLAFGHEYWVPRLAVGVLGVLAVPTIFLVGRALDPRLGAAVGALAAAALLSSPMYRLFSGLIMLEVPGTLLLLLAVLAALRSMTTGRRRDLLLASVASVTLFLCKYNYGLMWIVPWLLSEVWLDGSLLPGAARRVTELLRHYIHHHPAWSVFVSLYALFLASILMTGGWELTLLGQHVSVHSLGNPVLILMFVVLIRDAWYRGRGLRMLRGRIDDLPERLRLVTVAALGPMVLWLLIPPHLQDFFRFVQNRRAGPPVLSAESLLFYPRVFVEDYAATPVIGIAALVLAASALVRLATAKPGARLVRLALVFGLFASFGHPYKLPRFLFTVAPLVWLTAAAAAVSGLDRVAEMRPWRLSLGTRRFLLTTASAIILVAAALVGWDQDRWERDVLVNTVSASTGLLLDEVAAAAERSEGMVVLGSWNGLSPSLLAWHCRLYGVHERQIPTTVRTVDRGLDEAREELHRQVESRRIDAVAVVTALEGSEPARLGYWGENDGIEALAAELAEDPRFSVVAEREFPAAGYRLLWLRLLP